MLAKGGCVSDGDGGGRVENVGEFQGGFESACGVGWRIGMKVSRNRFDKPPDQNAHIDMSFSNSLSTDQQKDLECMVSKEEVKRAVWDCGTDKSPGPDGFTFGFYRHF
ncbi:hypothetical protein Tco_1254804 [Tanacetum coccineum]